MEQRTNPAAEEQEPARWRPLGALAGTLALRLAAEREARERRPDPAFMPLAWAAE